MVAVPTAVAMRCKAARIDGPTESRAARMMMRDSKSSARARDCASAAGSSRRSLPGILQQAHGFRQQTVGQAEAVVRRKRFF